MSNRKLPAALAVTLLAVSSVSLPMAFADTSAPQPIGHVSQLNDNQVVSSTIDPGNGDQNPYAVVIDQRPGSATDGQLFVSNFSNSAGINGAGSTIEEIENGKPVTYATGANGPAAMAFSPKGPLWIANFGQNGTDGNVQVTKPNGASFGTDGIVTNAGVQGPWGQAFAAPYQTASGATVPPAFFVTGALNGTVAAMYNFTPPTFNSTTQFDIIGSNLAHTGTSANNVQGPQGIVWDAQTHLLYVTDTADNSIRAFTWTGASTPNQGQGQLVYQGGALKAPVGIAIDPVNGDLLVVNQGNNNLVELTTGIQGGGAQVVGQSVLDNTPVNPQTGAGAALFGIAATKDASGNLVVYYTDDNTNTVNELSYRPDFRKIAFQPGTAIVVGSQTVGSPAFIQATDPVTGQSTSYVSVYWMQKALTQLGYTGTWDNGTWNITPPATSTVGAPQNLTTAAGFLATLTVNGQTFGYLPALIEHDPATKNLTTYVQLSALEQTLQGVGVTVSFSNNTFTLGANN